MLSRCNRATASSSHLRSYHLKSASSVVQQGEHKADRPKSVFRDTMARTEGERSGSENVAIYFSATSHTLEAFFDITEQGDFKFHPDPLLFEQVATLVRLHSSVVILEIRRRPALSQSMWSHLGGVNRDKPCYPRGVRGPHAVGHQGLLVAEPCRKRRV